MSRQPEARLQVRIVKALRAHGVPAWRIRPLGIAGWPDIYALPRGVAHHLEVKLEVPEIMIHFLPDATRASHPRGRKHKDHEPLQVHTLDELAAAGAVVGVVTSVEEALEMAIGGTT